ncbi:MAG: TlyA family RNA methyltransferase [Alphaproteobacteria bacterium]|nr:TlyA family RNA methyltransferase [Alphaproteobacteria bacterium]
MGDRADQGLRRQRADLLLVERGLVPSRARAQAEIAAGTVSADGVAVTHAAQKLPVTAELAIAVPENPYVSRGALKLAPALDHFGIGVAGARVLDVGASTGGFCDLVLARGAGHVVAVDVGHGQLHPRLAADPRVTALEGRDARTLTGEEAGAPDLLLVDVSFTRLDLVLPPVMAHVVAGGHMLALVKPQFEAGRAALGKGGLVRDPAARAAAVARVADMVSALDTWSVLGTLECPVRGGSGNIETWLAARAGSRAGPSEDLPCPSR